ncbi:hypothetical protein STEG23_036110 [Scotinomys teguina]
MDTCAAHFWLFGDASEARHIPEDKLRRSKRVTSLEQHPTLVSNVLGSSSLRTDSVSVTVCSTDKCGSFCSEQQHLYHMSKPGRDGLCYVNEAVVTRGRRTMILAKLCDSLRTDSLAEVMQWLLHASTKGTTDPYLTGPVLSPTPSHITNSQTIPTITSKNEKTDHFEDSHDHIGPVL